MVLSGETVIVRGCRLTKSSLADGCVCSSYLQASTDDRGKERETAPQALGLTSAAVIWYTTDSPSEYDCSVSCLTASRFSLLALPVRLPPHNSSGWTARTCQPPRQPPRKWQILRCTSNAFPENFKLVLLCLQFPSSLFVGGGRPFVSGEKQRFTASFKPNLSFLMNVLMGGCSERVKEWLNREPGGLSDCFVRSNDVLLWVIGQIIFHR